jgi:hypothetical protein
MCHFAGFETKQIMASDSSPCTQGCCQGTIEGRGYTLSCVLAYRHEHKRPENGLYRSVGADFWFHIYLRLATWSNSPVKVWPGLRPFATLPACGGERSRTTEENVRENPAVLGQLRSGVPPTTVKAIYFSCSPQLLMSLCYSPTALARRQ